MSKGDSVMPTKNTTKKVENNGYSKITSKAPDMENSTEVLFVPKPMKKKLTPHKPPAPKKPKAQKEKPVETVTVEDAVAVAEPVLEAEKPAVVEPVASEKPATEPTERAWLREEIERIIAAKRQLAEKTSENTAVANGAREEAETDSNGAQSVALKVEVTSAVMGGVSEETLDAVSPKSERSSYVNLGQSMPVHLL